MNVDKLILAALVVLTICRFVFTGQSELSPQESLWWMESQRLSWAYLEDGPVIPLVIRLSTIVLGDTAQAVRFWNPLLILLSTYWLFLIARSACNRTTARWSVVVFNLLPMVNFASVHRTDIGAALCFTLLTLWLLWCGLHRAKPGHWTWWLAGWAFALCMLTNFTLALFAFTPALVVTLIPRWRRQWKRPGIYVLLGVGLSLAVASIMRYGGWRFLVLYVQHQGLDWGLHLTEPLRAFATALLCTGPLLIVGGLWLRRHWRHCWSDHGLQFLTVATVVPLVIAFLLSACLGEPVMLWWFGLAPGLILIIHTWMQSDVPIETKVNWRRGILAATACMTLVGLNSDLIRGIGIPWPYAWDATKDQHGWQKSSLALESALRQSAERQDPPPFVIADSVEAAAALDFYLNRTTPLLQPHPHYPRLHLPESAGLAHQYHLWPNYSHEFHKGSHPFKGQTALYVTTADGESIPLNIQHAFKSTKLAAVLVIRRHNQRLMRWRFHLCYPYNGLPL